MKPWRGLEAEMGVEPVLAVGCFGGLGGVWQQ